METNIKNAEIKWNVFTKTVIKKKTTIYGKICEMLHGYILQLQAKAKRTLNSLKHLSRKFRKVGFVEILLLYLGTFRWSRTLHYLNTYMLQTVVTFTQQL
jgi:hypothetical protein